MEGQENQEHYSNYYQVQEQDQIRSRNNVSSHGGHTGDQVHLQTSCNNSGVIGLDESRNNHHHFPVNGIVLNPQGGGPVGLKLERSPSLIKGLELILNKGKQQETHEQQLVDDQPKKLKATNVQAALLKVGSWKWESKNEGDLVAKFYYGRKKLIREFLYRDGKKKIEIRWPQISAINSFVREDKKGVLEIELNEQPEYYKEKPCQAGKHTMWESSDDFTDGQAPVCRRHTVVFLPGVLDEAFKKLLQCDSRLLHIRRQPFPTLNSPLFCNQKILDFSNNRSVVVHGSYSVPAVSNHGNSSLPLVSNHGSSSVPPVSISSSVPPVSISSSVPPVSNHGSSSVPPVSNYGSSSIPAVFNYGSSSVPLVANYGSSSVPPVSNYGHQGTFQNLIQPTSSFVEHFNSNLQMPDLEFSNSHELAMRASFENQRVDGIWEQSGNIQVDQEISFPPIGDQQDHLLANHGEDSLIPDQEVDLTDVENLADSFIPDRQHELDIHNPNDEFEVESLTCNPFRQNHQINSLQPSGGNINGMIDGFTFADFDQSLETNNSWNPMETRIHDSNNHMAYIDEDLCGVNHGPGFDNNGFSFMQPSSLPPSQFSIQDFNNGGNWMNEMGYTDNNNLYSYDLSGGIAELALQNPNLGAN